MDQKAHTRIEVDFPTSPHAQCDMGSPTIASSVVALRPSVPSLQTCLHQETRRTLIGMGGIRYQQQRWLDAIEYLDKSRTADPDALFLLCDAYYRVGKPKQAVLTAEVIRALGSDRKPLLDKLQKLVLMRTTKLPGEAIR